MRVVLSVKLQQRVQTGARVSVRADFALGGFTISNILARCEGGKLRITYPLTKSASPAISLRGPIKQAVNAAVLEALKRGGADGAEYESECDVEVAEGSMR